MNVRHWLSCLFVVVLAYVVRPMKAEEAGIQAAISVRSFSTNNVIGVLGVPVGTIVRVSGVASDGNDTKLKAYDGTWLVEIERVNGVPLKDKLRFPVSPNEAGDIKSLGRFECYVAEYGSFVGLARNPDGIEVEDTPQTSTTTGFHYHPRLIFQKWKTRKH